MFSSAWVSLRFGIAPVVGGVVVVGVAAGGVGVAWGLGVVCGPGVVPAGVG